jgi:hypothetical protein
MVQPVRYDLDTHKIKAHGHTQLQCRAYQVNK